MWKIRKIDRVIRKTGNQVENRGNSGKIGRLGISAVSRPEKTGGICLYIGPIWIYVWKQFI